MNIAISQLMHRHHSVIDELENLWESSVRATHDFLTEDDIRNIKPLVRQGLLAIPVLCVAKDERNHILGFMGVENNKIEMLFVDPQSRGLGVGRQCIVYAVRVLKTTLVDVNEQNCQAVGFYHHMGFSVFKRSPTDGQGNPFPLLHMQLETPGVIHSFNE